MNIMDSNSLDIHAPFLNAKQTKKKHRKKEFPTSCEKYPKFILIVPFHRMIVTILTVK